MTEQPKTRTQVTDETGKTVASNVRRVRELRGLSTYELSRMLGRAERPIAPSALAKVERGERRVDVGDLVALAIVLNTSPISLLLPPTWGYTDVNLTGKVRLTARTAWRWIRGLAPASDYGISPTAIVGGPDDGDWEEELDRKYWQLRQDYDAVTLPPELRRVRENPASRDADAVTFQVERLIRMAGGKASDKAFEEQMAVTEAAIDRLSTELERLAEDRARRRTQAGGS